MRINNNLMAMNTNRQLGISNKAGAKSMEKLSSGFRINRASDDAAGLSISEKMRNQIKGLNRASANSQDGISLIQTAEGALDETQAILKRMRELTVQAGNEGTLQQDDLDAIKDEFKELTDELTGISERTEFNGKKLLNGSYEGTIQIGANQKQQLDLDVDVKEIKSEGNAVLKDEVIVRGKEFGRKLSVAIDNKDMSVTASSDINSIIFVDGSGSTEDVEPKAEIKNGVLTITGGWDSKKSAKLDIGIEDIKMAMSKNTDLKDSFLNIEGDTSVKFKAVDQIKFTVEPAKEYAATEPVTGAKFSSNKDIIKIEFKGATSDTDKLKATKNGDTLTITGDWDTAAKDATLDDIKKIDLSAYGVTIADGDDTKTIGTGSTIGLDLVVSKEAPKEVAGVDRVYIGGGSVSSKDLGVALSKDKLAAGDKLEDILKEGVFFGFEGMSQEDVKMATDANLERMDAANKAVSTLRSHLGANQNRLEHTIRNLDNAAENIQASESRIRDVDMAKEMIENTKQNILQQASTAMLAQANQAPQSVLRLLG